MSAPSATTPQPLDGSASFRVSGQRAGETARLSARSLRVGYRVGPGAGPDRERTIARDLDLDLRPGELVCLLGPNGAGKSTLLRTLAGLQEPLAGHVEIDGRPFAEWRPRQLARRLAVVLTDRTLPAAMTGADLVRLGRHPHTPWTGTLSGADRAAVQSALEAVDALYLAPRPLAEMSDGERQKVTIARALAQEADVLVLDEVTAFLDLPRRVEIVRLLRRLAHDEADGRAKASTQGRAIVLATHDLDLALRSADRLWLLSPPRDGSPGTLRQGIPEALVLDGSFETAFAAEGVDFDRTSGSFRLHRRHRGTAWVEGEDDSLAALWTRRALDRLGFELEPDSELRLTVEETPSGTSWAVVRPTTQPTPIGGSPRRYARLEEALAELTGPTGPASS